MRSKQLMLAMMMLAVGMMTTLASAAEGAEGEPSLIPVGTQAIATSVATLVIFCLLLAVLGKFAWGPISKGLQAREAKIKGDIDTAEQARKAAEKALAEYNKQLENAQVKVSEIIQKAAGEAEKVAETIRLHARNEAEEIKEKAIREIDQARQEALETVYTTVAELATSAAEKIIRKNLNVDDQRALVAQSLQELKQVSNN